MTGAQAATDVAEFVGRTEKGRRCLPETFSLAEYADIIREVLDSGGEFTLFPRGTSMRRSSSRGATA